MAKYDVTNNHWVYASAITSGQDGLKYFRKITFPETSVDNYLETESNSKHYVPESSATLIFADEDDGSTPDKENLHDFYLEDATLYKFVEITAPEGYTQLAENASLEENDDFVFYYAYNGYDGTIPDDAKDANGRSKIRNIVVNGTLNIPNTKGISIKAQKTFTGTEADLPDSAEVKLKLYYSTNRSGTNLTPVTSATVESGQESFVNPVTLNYNKNTNIEPIAEWKHLPSGMNGNPVYYFVKEESFKYDDNTYTLDETDGKFKCNGSPSKFQPVYTRNGTNKDGTVIQVNNSEGVQVKKSWVNLNGKSVEPPKDSDGNPMAIKFDVYGLTGNYRVKLDLTDEECTLNADNGYKLFLPDEVGLTGVTSSSMIEALDYTADKKYPLSYFTNFEIEEMLTPEQSQELYGKFGNPKSTRMIENGTGILELINTDICFDTVGVGVEKIWNDNNASHSSESIMVKLIQSTNPNLNTNDLIKIANSERIEKVYTVGSDISSTNKVYLVEKGQSENFTFARDIKSIIGKDESLQYSHNRNVLTISSNNETISEVLTIVFDDDTEQDITVSVVEYELTLNQANDWKASWEGLPVVSDDGDSYYYYALEEDVPENYEVSYQKTITSQAQEVIITNRLPTTILVNKEWYDGTGKITDYTRLPEKIKVEVYQKLEHEEEVTGENVEKPNNIKIIALGDSITNGSSNQIAEQYRYWYRLKEKLQNANGSIIALCICSKRLSRH